MWLTAMALYNVKVVAKSFFLFKRHDMKIRGEWKDSSTYFQLLYQMEVRSPGRND
jgi:hypothetical protein